MSGVRTYAVIASMLLVAACGGDGTAAPLDSIAAQPTDTDGTNIDGTTVDTQTTEAEPTTVPPPSSTAVPDAEATTTTATTSPTTEQVDDTADTTKDAIAAVTDYLFLLAAGRYDQAATMLGRGEEGLEMRLDLSALRPAPSPTQLGDALRVWCTTGAQCTTPTGLTAQPSDDGTEVTATWDLGGASATAAFTVTREGGETAVRGLPPLTTDAALSTIATVARGTAVVAAMPDGRILALKDGTLAELPVPADASVWSDGEFVFWRTDGLDESGEYATRSAALRFDGTVLCEVDGSIHRLRERPGSDVASAELEPAAIPSGGEYEIPNYAIDCTTGRRTAIESISFRREGGFRRITKVAGKTFEVQGDAEGNADIVNSRGTSINGDDYAGFHTFSPDGSLVVYGDYGVGVSPHLTETIRARSTGDGSLRWSADLHGTFNALNVTSTRVLVSMPPEAFANEPWTATEHLEVFDAATGEWLQRIPTAIELISVS